MHLKTGELAFTGIMAALSVLLILAGCYIDSSTIFFLAAAAYLTGVVEYNCKLAAGIIHLCGSFVVGIVIAPQKLYCITFLCFGVYILVAELLEAARFNGRISVRMLWSIKCILFQILFFTMFFVYNYFVGFDDALIISGIIAGAEVFWIIYDRAYIMFQRKYGHMFRIRRR